MVPVGNFRYMCGTVMFLSCDELSRSLGEKNEALLVRGAAKMGWAAAEVKGPDEWEEGRGYFSPTLAHFRKRSRHNGTSGQVQVPKRLPG